MAPPKKKPDQIQVTWDTKQNRPDVQGCGQGTARWFANELFLLLCRLETTHGYDCKTLKMKVDKLPPPKPKAEPVNPESAKLSDDIVDEAGGVVV